jgi:hypothetical protein
MITFEIIFNTNPVLMKKSIFTLLLLFPFLPVWSQADTVPPVLECHGITDLFFFPECTDTILIFDLIDSLSDDQTPAGSIEVGMRKACTGEGFPAGVHELIVSVHNLSKIDVWARDATGNVTVRQVVVYLSNGLCDEGHILSATMPVPNTTPPEIYDVNIDFRLIDGCTGDTTLLHKNTEQHGGFILFGTIIPDSGYGVEAEASKSIHPANGVTVTDLVLITRHILGIEPLDSPYKIIAADASQDGVVTVYDVVLLRKLILGLIDELPNGKSWRFVPKAYVFPDPGNPFSPMFPTQITSTNEEQGSNTYEYIGVKIGDVNYSANPTQ